jgi:uridine kinase
MNSIFAKKPFIVGIAGPSGAGKSVLCKALQSTLPNVSRLKLDDFFKNIEEVPRYMNWVHWDIPSSLNWDQLIQAAKDLKNGKHAMVPNYSRKENKAVGEKCVFPSQIMLLDGFMTLYDARLRDLIDVSLFFDLPEDQQIKRRIQRQPDVEEGYLHHIMIPCARKYIMPSKNYADHIIDAEKSPEKVAQDCTTIIKKTILTRV